MKIRLSERIERLSESATLQMAAITRRLKNEGKDIINLTLGEPDFNTPQHIKTAAKEAIDNNFTHYPPVAGCTDLREAIVKKYKQRFGVNFSIKEVIVSTGAKQSLMNLFLTIVDKGDEVIIPSPYWVSYPEMVRFSKGKVVNIKAEISNDFKITPQQIEQAITPNTKVFLFNSPSNPTGTVYTEQEIRAIADVLKKFPNIFIVSDEIYEQIIFEGKHFSFSEIPELRDRMIIVNGVSKGFAMTGWRIGYILAPTYIIKAIVKLQGQYTSGTCYISQKAAIAALNGNLEPTIKMREEFRKRRDIMIEMLSKIDGLKVNKPDGAFYLFIDVKNFLKNGINTATDLAMFILEKGNVSLVSGDAFGSDGYLRISYATSTELLVEAVKRLKKVFDMITNS